MAENKKGDINESSNSVVVEKGKLDAVLSELSALRSETQMLKSIADKGELAKFHEKQRDKEKRSCRLRVLRDGENAEKKVVVGWGPMLNNEVYQNDRGLTVAKQIVKVFLEDGKEIVGDLLEIGRRYEFILAEKVGEEKDDQGNIFWKVKAENGKEYKVDFRCIN